MKWRTRAALLRSMAGSSTGRWLYRTLQRRMGAHTRPAYLRTKLGYHAELARLIRGHGREIEGAEVVEVGSGWLPLLPLAFWGCGARRVRSYDLNPHLIPELLGVAAAWIADSEEEVAQLWSEFAPEAAVRRRIGALRELRDDPAALMQHAGIEVYAPANAAATGIPTGTVDIHYSLSVFEHIAPEAIPGILSEAARLLAPGGLAAHWIDPSDHFSHSDPTIPRFHFLRFEAAEWERLAGNEFAYHNRLRLPEFRALWEASPLQVLDCRSQVHEQALADLQRGFPLAAAYRAVDPELLCSGRIQILATGAHQGGDWIQGRTT